MKLEHITTGGSLAGVEPIQIITVVAVGKDPATTPEDAAYALEYLLSRAWQVFADLHFYKLIAGKFPGWDPYAYAVLQNATIDSSFSSIRLLDSFFSDQRSRPTDLISVDFGFQSSSPLQPDEREAINQKLLHLTCRAAREFRADPTLSPLHWPYFPIVKRVAERMQKFILHLEASGYPVTLEIRSLLETTANAMQLNLAELTELAAQDAPKSQAFAPISVY